MSSSTKRLVLVIDQQRCVGCWTCAVTCKAENNVGLGNWWNRILTSDGEQDITGLPVAAPDGSPDMEFRPYACMHCQSALCVKACPTKATYKREDGITAQDYSKCVGCRTCMAACPYNVRVFNWEKPAQVPVFEDDHIGNAQVPSRSKGVVEKCTFCKERTDQGELPACVKGCPAHARFFGDLNDPESEVSRLISERHGSVFKPEFSTEPSVYYLPRRRKQTNKKTVFGDAGSPKAAVASTAATSIPPSHEETFHKEPTAIHTSTLSASPGTEFEYSGNCCVPAKGGSSL